MPARILIQTLIGCVLANNIYRFAMNTFWICRLCYGQSPTHENLVKLGEAIDIIAGQPIGEPGT
ncbi:hypothetical protein HN51_066235 [Arachis hypogaea]